MNYLIAFRKSRGLSRKDMADKLGVSLSWYEKVELNDRQPSRELLAKIKEKFPTFDMNIFFDELLHETRS